ncbi:MAG TPA: tetratricopeptide repeat protein [Candidatus Binatia bacterium]|nr:tetratricopeptide repeat protein [Candidatus Binatia bacterium]
MKRGLAFALILAIAPAGCGTYEAWSKRREARALERKIESQQQALKKMSPSALEQAEAESRDRAIAQYEKILKDYSDVGRDEMDESLYLLGRLQFEREQQDFQRGQRSFEGTRLEAEAAGKQAGPEPKPRYPSAKAVYERLLHDFPDSAFREDALYDLGYILTEEGDRAGGAALLEKLVKEKPRSRYAPEIHFRLAEYAFDSNKLAAAEEQYRAVVKKGPADLVDKALFKLGWVYYNLDRYDDAKQVLAEVLRRQSERMEKEGREFAPAPILFFPGPRRATFEDIEEKEAKGADVYQEILEVLARIYADSGGADALVSFLRSEQHGKLPRPYAAPLMHRLALVQKERSAFEAAEHSYQLLLDTYPTFRDAPKIELELVDVLVGQKQMDQAARVREGMLAKYDQASPWGRANPEQESRDAAMAEARKGLEWSIQYYHSRGLELQKEKGGTPDELRHAVAAYERYLKRFPEGEPSYEQRFLYAQALYAAGEYGRAADVFRAVSFDKGFDKHREEAALSRILSVEKLSEGQKSPLPPTVIDGLVAAYEDYIKLNPAGDKNAALLFKEGKLYFEAQKFPAAIAAFDRLIREHSGDPLAAEAHDLIAQAHFRLGDFAAAEQWSEKALASAGPNNALGARRDEVEKLYALTMFKQAEKADDEKQYREASKDYLRLVDKLPRNEIAPRALYNAATATDHAKQSDDAARLYQRLLDGYTDSDLAPDAAVRLAEYYKDKPGGTDRIIDVYERVADTHVDSPKGEEFLFLAGKLAAKEHKAPETIRLFEKFLSRYRSPAADPRGQRTVEALYHLGTTYAGAGNAIAARQNLEQFLAQPHSAQASFGEGNEGYAYAVANAHLLLGNALSQDYRGARIAPPVAENLKRKQSLLTAVVDQYTPAVASGLSPIATQASFGIGNAYEEFGSALEEAPRPPGLSAEERSEYDRLLEDKVRPFLKRAVNAYRVTVRAAREKSLDDEWVTRCRTRLAAVAPRAFARTPRPGYQRLSPTADPPPEVLSTFAGAPVSADSGPGFFGSLVAGEKDSRLRAFAKGLGAAKRTPPEWADAYAHFAEAAKDGPPEAGYNAAVAAMRQGNLSQATVAIEEVMRRHSDFPAALALAARLYDQTGRRDAAASAYRRAVESPKSTAAEKIAWARFLERQKQTAEALGLYQSVLGAEPANGEAALGVARLGPSTGGEELGKLLGPLGRSPYLLVELGVLAAERDAPRVARDAFAAARAELPPTDRTALAIVLSNEAQAALAAGEPDRAASLLASAAQADPANPAVANASGIVLMRRGDFQGAEAEFRKAVKAAPTYGAAWANLGILNELYFGSPDQAIQCYNQYLATKPADEPVVTGWIREIREEAHAPNKSI